MSDFSQAFAISSSGMSLERLRLETAAANIANAHTTRGVDGQVYQPLRVVAHAKKSSAPTFETKMADKSQADVLLNGVGDVSVVPMNVSPRLQNDPGHPDADAKGMVAIPQINPMTEMLTVMTAVRAYQANIHTLNAAKAMALKALEIGSNR